MHNVKNPVINKFIVILFFISLIYHSSFSFAKSYSNPIATITYTLNPDGTVSVHEEITYFIECYSSDCYHELYTWHPPSLKITSPSGYCTGANCRFFTQYNQGNYELVLRNDNGFKTGTYSAIFDYTLEGEILEQKDTAQFFYKIWYDQWPNEITYLAVKINLPNQVNNTIYFVHPPHLHFSVLNQSNSILISSKKHPANQYLEINLLMPKEWFTNLRKAPIYMSKEDIIKGEEISNIIFGIFSFISVAVIPFLIIFFPLLSFLYFYFIYGREENLPELKTLPVYIRDISEIDETISPTEAYMLLNPKEKDTEIQVSNILSSEVMELIRLGYLKPEIKESKKLFIMKEQELFLIPVEKDDSNLSEIQKMLLNFIKSNLVNGMFSFKSVMEQKKIKEFANFLSSLSSKAKSLLGKKHHISFKGVRAMANLFGLWSGIIILIIFVFSNSYYAPFALLGLIINSILGILFFINQGVLGKWTKKGRIAHEKMKRYKKFMEDLTSMKDKNIKDVILWDKLLVYATALGVADKVYNAMKELYPETDLLDWYIKFRVYKSATFYTLKAIEKAKWTSRSGYSGISMGGFGGGFGGGGGGGGAR